MPWAGAFKGQPRFSVVPMGLGTAYYYEGTATEGDRLAGMGLIVQGERCVPFSYAQPRAGSSRRRANSSRLWAALNDVKLP